MLPITEFLGYSCATAGTILSRVTGIHLDQAGTSLFSFVPQERDEFGPRSVVDVLCKAATRECLHLESFDRDHVVVAYEASARLMEVVVATTNRCRMTPSHCDARFTTVPGATFLPRERTLRDSQPALRQASGLEAGNHCAVGECGKGRDPEIHADPTPALAQEWCRHLDGKTHRPSLDIAPKNAALDDGLRGYRP